MRTRFIHVILMAGAVSARATMPVIDYSHIAQTAANQVVNFAKYTQTALKETETALNTLRTYENTVLQVARMGNPAALKNLPVIRDVAELVGTGQQLMQDYQQIRAMTNPQYMKGQLSSVVSAYQLQNWNPMAPGAYAFPSASYQVSQTVQEKMEALEQQRQRLEQKRDVLLQSLQSATTTADVQKYHAALDGVNGGIAELAARANELAQRATLENQQLQAGRDVQRQQTTERGATSFSSGVVNDMDSLSPFAPDYTQPAPRWPGGVQ